MPRMLCHMAPCPASSVGCLHPSPFVGVSDLISVIFGVIDICFVWPGLLFAAAAAALPVLTPSILARENGDLFGGF